MANHLKPFVFIKVDDEDVLEDEIEVEEKPVLITQDDAAQCDPKPVEILKKKKRRKKKLRFSHIKRKLRSSDSKPVEIITRKKRRKKKLKFSHIKRKLRSSAQLASKPEDPDVNEDVNCENKADSSDNEEIDVCGIDPVNHSNDNDFLNVSKAECILKPDNKNDTELNTQSIGEEEEVEILDPLENHCDLETTKNVTEVPIRDIQKRPRPNTKNNSGAMKIDINSLTSYIKKLCLECQKISDLVQHEINAPANKMCNICRNPVVYCCKLCLSVNNLKELYIHVFKMHCDNNERVIAIPTEDLYCGKCGIWLQNATTLKAHELLCGNLPNLFCQFCPFKLRTKKEMRQHMMLVHLRKFNLTMLEELLDRIVQEGDKVMSMLTLHNGYCTTCKRYVPLTNRPIYCVICTTKLIYHCKNPGCSSEVFKKLNLLQQHLRCHANSGWTKGIHDQKKYDAQRKRCHICRSFVGTRSQVSKHMTREHPDIVRCTCDSCGKTLKNVPVWKKHRERYCPVTCRKLQCEHCWFRTFRKTRLRKHLKSVHTHLYTGKRSQCNKCGITWAGLYRLRWHSTRCSGDFKVEKAKQRELWAMRGVVTLS